MRGKEWVYVLRDLDIIKMGSVVSFQDSDLFKCSKRQRVLFGGYSKRTQLCAVSSVRINCVIFLSIHTVRLVHLVT
jgi:hypothetical protein